MMKIYKIKDGADAGGAGDHEVLSRSARRRKKASNFAARSNGPGSTGDAGVRGGSRFGQSLTARERKAWRSGYLQAIADDATALEVRRIRMAARSLDVAVPRRWPTSGAP